MDPPTSPSAKHYDTIAFRATKISLLNLPHEALKNIFFFVSVSSGVVLPHIYIMCEARINQIKYIS